MGLLKIFKGKSNGQQVSEAATREISDVAQICEESECCGDCSQEEVEDLEELDKVFQKLKIDEDTPLFHSSKVPKVHFVVPTSQMDWAHDACDEKEGSVQYNVNRWCQSHMEKFSGAGQGETFTTAVSSLPKDIMDIAVMRGTKNNVLVLPHFLWIKELEADKVDETLDDLVPALLDQSVSKKQLLETKTYLSEAKEQSFIFVCSHTKRDKRCGITAPYLKKAFDRELQRLGLYRDVSDLRPDGVNVAFVNHVGGHKFAANVQVYIKKTSTLVWLARITPSNVPCIVEGIVLPEKPMLPWPEKVRCIQKYQLR